MAARAIKIATVFRPSLMTLAVRAALGSADALVTLLIRQHDRDLLKHVEQKQK